MPAKSSASSETTTRRRKKVTKRTTKSDDKASDESSDEVAVASATNDDGEAAPRPKRRKKATRRAKAESDTDSASASSDEVFGDGLQEEKPAPRKRRSRRDDSEKSESREVESSSNDRGSERASSDSGGPSGDSGESNSGDGGGDGGGGDGGGGDGGGGDGGGRENERGGGEGGDDQPRRRRRRRRGRRGRGEGTAPNNTGGGGGGGRGQNSGGRQGGNSGGGGRGRDRGGRQRRGRQNQQVSSEVTGSIEGILELHPKGYGFIRDPEKNYAAQDTDSFVSSSMIERHKLREGIMIRGDVGPGAKGQGPRLKTISSIDGRTLDEYAEIKSFEDLTPINPFEQIKLERGPKPVTMRVMDLVTPIGKGQRALIVAPPRTGKTMLLQDIADSVSLNHPEVHLIVLLIDERPEEVTEMKRRVKGEVIASSMDRDVESHVRISQLIIERGKRIAESGGEVFILMDSITRTARAFNKWVGNTGRTMSGGLDVKALDIPKKMFGTARRFDEGGSLTVAATALIDTGSRMDEVIFQEFKGTGNMELVLSRELSDRRIWPAIDITLSGTRREEKILSPEVLDGTTLLRRSLISLSPVEAMEQLTRTLERFPTNQEFLTRIRDML